MPWGGKKLYNADDKCRTWSNQGDEEVLVTGSESVVDMLEMS